MKSFAVSRASEKPVDILVTVPRACGPEDLDPSNYEHFHKAQPPPPPPGRPTSWEMVEALLMDFGELLSFEKFWEVLVGINNLITIHLYEGNAFLTFIIDFLQCL